jgi:hypothetical protein
MWKINDLSLVNKQDVFYSDSQLATIFISLITLQIWYNIKFLTNFTQKSFCVTAQVISVLNSKIKLMKETFLQN